MLEGLASQHKIAAISRESGIKTRSFYDWIANGSTNGKDMLAIATWLTAHGYLEGAPVPTAPDHPPPNEDAAIDAMAKDLEALAATLRSPIPKDMKARAFAERVTFWYESMREYLRRIKEQK